MAKKETGLQLMSDVFMLLVFGFLRWSVGSRGARPHKAALYGPYQSRILTLVMQVTEH